MRPPKALLFVQHQEPIADDSSRDYLASMLIIDDLALHLRLIEDISHDAGFTDIIAIDSADGAPFVLQAIVCTPRTQPWI